MTASQGSPHNELHLEVSHFDVAEINVNILISLTVIQHGNRPFGSTPPCQIRCHLPPKLLPLARKYIWTHFISLPFLNLSPSPRTDHRVMSTLNPLTA